MVKKTAIVDTLPICDETKEFIKKHKLSFRNNNMGKHKDGKYKKSDFLRCYKGYDAFEKLIIVRHYVQRKHNISINLLEILLYLFPKQYFTHLDYGIVAKQFTYQKMHNFKKTGMLEVAIRGTHVNRTLYTLSNKAKRIVFEFYELMAGEKEIPVDSSILTSKEASYTDKKIVDMIKVLKGETTSKEIYQEKQDKWYLDNNKENPKQRLEEKRKRVAERNKKRSE